MRVMKISGKIRVFLKSRGPAARAVFVFLVLGIIWALVTDYLLGRWVADLHSFVRFEIIKAWIFIGLAGAVLYWFIRADFRHIDHLHRQRQQALQQLQSREQELRTLLDLLPDAIFRIDQDGIIRAAHLPQTTTPPPIPKQVMGLHLRQILPSAVCARALDFLQNALHSGQILEEQFELDSAGKKRFYEARILARNAHEASVTVRDLTEQREAERLADIRQQQLLQTDKLATLGIMVSGVAHEINNPNNYILLNGKIIARLWQDVQPWLEQRFKEEGDFNLAGMPYSKAKQKIGLLIDGITDGARRIEEIVSTFKDFARQDSGDLNQEVDLNQVIDTALIILNTMIKKATDRLQVQKAASLPAVRGNAQQLEQVLVNLITNACQALPDKSRVLQIGSSLSDDGKEVVVRVYDEGIGITKENLKHIFDPFFTSKRDAGGTGLGLSIAYRIMENHGGRLEIESKSEQFTEARMILPSGPERQENN